MGFKNYIQKYWKKSKKILIYSSTQIIFYRFKNPKKIRKVFWDMQSEIRIKITYINCVLTALIQWSSSKPMQKFQMIHSQNIDASLPQRSQIYIFLHQKAEKIT